MGSPTGAMSRQRSATDPAAFRAAMGLFPTGVAIVTTGASAKAEAMTVNSVISVSLDPLLFLVSIHRDARLNRRIRAEGCYAASILARDHRGLSDLFASPRRPAGLRAVRALGDIRGTTGTPLVAGALASIECGLEAVVAGGDHDLFLGGVRALAMENPDAEPLVFHRGRYPDPAENPVSLGRVGRVGR